MDFFATCSNGSAESGALQTLDSVAEFEQLLGDHVCSLQRALEKGPRANRKEKSNVLEVSEDLSPLDKLSNRWFHISQ